MFVPMSRENLDLLAKEVNGEVVTIRESNFLIIQGLTIFVTKQDAVYKISVYKPEINRNANSLHSDEQWGRISTSINVSAEKPLATIGKDILRRFDFKRMVEVKQMFDDDLKRYEELKVQHKILVDELAESCGREVVRRDTGVESEIPLRVSDEYYGSIKISYTSVEIHVRSLKNHDIAKKIAALLRPTAK
jgi:hypothetical protein